MLILSAQRASAQGVISSEGDFDGWTVLFAGQAFAASWEQTIRYEDVSISANLTAFGRTTETGRAFLTTRLGPGTTIADQVAFTTFAFPAVESDVVLFSDLTLAPATYYLTLVGDSASWGSGWTGSVPALYDVGPGVTWEGTYGFRSPQTPFLPSSAIWDDTMAPPHFTVTGTPIPEPSTYAAILGVAVLVGVALSRRRGRSEQSA